MTATYRFGAAASYGRRALAVATLGTIASLASGCSGEKPPLPPNVVVASHVPATWPTPQARGQSDDPTIVAARFSSLDVPLGDRWSGDIVASTNARSVVLHTNLFDIAAKRVAAGRFHFDVRVYDLPAFLVRPYALHMVARNAAGRETTLLVPFRIGGRTARETEKTSRV
jgi:hypothetical protein